jgi:hypothetical protein
MFRFAWFLIRSTLEDHCAELRLESLAAITDSDLAAHIFEHPDGGRSSRNERFAARQTEDRGSFILSYIPANATAILQILFAKHLLEILLFCQDYFVVNHDDEQRSGEYERIQRVKE